MNYKIKDEFLPINIHEETVTTGNSLYCDYYYGDTKQIDGKIIGFYAYRFDNFPCITQLIGNKKSVRIWTKSPNKVFTVDVIYINS